MELRLSISDTLRNLQQQRLIEEKAKLIDIQEYGSLIQVFRDNFDTFQETLDFYDSHPRYSKLSGKNGLQMIQQDLNSVGVVRESDNQPISTDHISSLMNKVRAERGLAKSREPRSKKEMSAHALAKQKVLAISAGSPARPMPAEVTEALPGLFVRPAPISEHVDLTLKRLRKEAENEFKAPWSGQDEFFLMSVLYPDYEMQKSKNINPNFWTVTGKSEFQFSSKLLKEGRRILEAKLNELKLFDAYRNI